MSDLQLNNCFGDHLCDRSCCPRCPIADDCRAKIKKFCTFEKKEVK